MALDGSIWRLVHGPEDAFEQALDEGAFDQDQNLSELHDLCMRHAPHLVARVKARIKARREPLTSAATPDGAHADPGMFRGFGKETRPGPPVPAKG